MYKLKPKDSETKPYLLRLGNILNDSTIQNMKKTGLIGYTHAFFVDYNMLIPKIT